MAGESARALAKRQREKAERLNRSAELYERGAEGEQATADALKSLPADSWTVFHDVRWPGRRYANIDHVVVGPPGVFVIDSKNWSGSITVRDDVLRANGWSRETTVAAAADSAVAVAELVPLLPVDLVKPVLCFVRDEPLTGWARDVMVCSTANVAAMLLSRPVVLGGDELRQLTLDVDAGVRAAAEVTVTCPSPTPKPTPRTRSRSTSSRRTRSVRANAIKAVAAFTVAGILWSQPAVLDRVSETIGWLTSDLSETDEAPTSPKDKKPVRSDEEFFFGPGDGAFGDENVVPAEDDGTWSGELTVPAGLDPDLSWFVSALCFSGPGEDAEVLADYDLVEFDVTGPPTTTPTTPPSTTPPPTTPPEAPPAAPVTEEPDFTG